MKGTLLQAIGLQDTLSKFTESKLPLPTTYKLYKLTAGIRDDVKFFMKEYNKLLVKYAATQENGAVQYQENGNVLFKEGFEEIAQNEYTSLINTEIDLPDIKFTLKELENCNDVLCSLDTIQSLMPFIEE